MTDSEGFQYKYVPKDHILSEDAVRNGKGVKRERKGTETSTGSSYMYVKKNKQNDTTSQNSASDNSSAYKGHGSSHKKS